MTTQSWGLAHNIRSRVHVTTLSHFTGYQSLPAYILVTLPQHLYLTPLQIFFVKCCSTLYLRVALQKYFSTKLSATYVHCISRKKCSGLIMMQPFTLRWASVKLFDYLNIIGPSISSNQLTFQSTSYIHHLEILLLLPGLGLNPWSAGQSNPSRQRPGDTWSVQTALHLWLFSGEKEREHDLNPNSPVPRKRSF